MTDDNAVQPATDAAVALTIAPTAWTHQGADMDGLTRLGGLDYLSDLVEAFQHEVAWERRRAILELRGAGHSLAEIARLTGRHVSGLNQLLTGDRCSSADGPSWAR